MSLPFTKFASLPAVAGCESRDRITIGFIGELLFYYWLLLRNNNMPTNLRRCTSSFGGGTGRRFAECNCWRQVSWQVMQQHSDCW